MKHKLCKHQKKARLVEVWWIDSIGDANAWTPNSEADHWAKLPLSTIVSVGFVLRDDKEQIAICGHISQNNKASMWAIPKKCVVRIFDLERGR